MLTLRTWDVGTKTVGTFWGVPWYSDRLPMTIVARRTLASAHLHVLLNSYGTVGGQAMLIIAAPTRSSYGTGFVWQSLALRVLRLSELQSLRSMLVVRPKHFGWTRHWLAFFVCAGIFFPPPPLYSSIATLTWHHFNVASAGGGRKLVGRFFHTDLVCTARLNLPLRKGTCRLHFPCHMAKWVN